MTDPRDVVSDELKPPFPKQDQQRKKQQQPGTCHRQGCPYLLCADSSAMSCQQQLNAGHKLHASPWLECTCCLLQRLGTSTR